ncbi:MAG: hypothetical protein HY548_10315 [Elusimicrobia bacterium]|nr:hypothetical protein [Elusimicrobiota bacterium]
MKQPDFKSCQFCGSKVLKFRWQVFSNRTKHLRVDCEKCGRCLGYAPQTEEFLGRLIGVRTGHLPEI